MATGKKTGGRKLGTPNKTTSVEREFVQKFLNAYAESGDMAKDFSELEPKDRLTIAEKFMQYIMPKYQSIAMDVNATAEVTSLEQKLANMSEECSAKK